jgi:hypothetical protein
MMCNSTSLRIFATAVNLNAILNPAYSAAIEPDQLLLEQCNEGDQISQSYGMGSRYAVVKGKQKERCILEYQEETEGGYTLYQCVFSERKTMDMASIINKLGTNCKLEKQGNFLMHQTSTDKN